MESAVLGSVSEFRDALNTVQKYLDNDLWSCSGGQLVELLRDWHRLRAQVDSVQPSLIREVIARGIPAQLGAVDARSFLTGALTMSPTEATSSVKLAQALGTDLLDTATALAQGRICRERAKAILEVIDGLPKPVTAPERVEVEQILLEHAGELNSQQIRKLRTVLEFYLDPDGTEPREKAARSRRGAFLHPNSDGTTTLKWVDTTE